MASPDLAAAISSLLNDDQDRILSVASTLRAPGRTIESTVKGTSMGSGLPPDSRIRIDLSPSGTHRVGEVVAFVGGGQVIVHRVVHVGRLYLLTRGDARVAPDTPVKPEQVLGPVRAVSRGGQWTSLDPPPRRSRLGRACAPVVLLIARGLLHLGPGIAGGAMRLLHALEARTTQLVFGRRAPGSR